MPARMPSRMRFWNLAAASRRAGGAGGLSAGHRAADRLRQGDRRLQGIAHLRVRNACVEPKPSPTPAPAFGDGGRASRILPLLPAAPSIDGGAPLKFESLDPSPMFHGDPFHTGRSKAHARAEARPTRSCTWPPAAWSSSSPAVSNDGLIVFGSARSQRVRRRARRDHQVAPPHRRPGVERARVRRKRRGLRRLRRRQALRAGRQRRQCTLDLHRGPLPNASGQRTRSGSLRRRRRHRRSRRHHLRHRGRALRRQARRQLAVEVLARRHALRLQPGAGTRRHDLLRLPGRRALRDRSRHRPEALGVPHRRRRRTARRWSPPTARSGSAPTIASSTRWGPAASCASP